MRGRVAVPIMIKYRSKGHFFAEGGIQLGLLYKAYDVFTNMVLDDEDLSYKLNIEDQYYRLLGGNGMNLGVRYYYGFAVIAKDDTAPGQYNRSIFFTVGIPIGAGKEPKKSGS